MESSFSSGISGLQSYQEMLDVVGNNLANLDTTGFKSQSVQFSDLFYQNNQSGSGTNPGQIGSGVSGNSIATDLSQGTLTNTGNSLDLAIQGNGYFVVNGGGQTLYTRAGSFSVNQNGFLVDSATGALVQRTGSVGEGSATSPAFQTSGNNNIQIAFGTTIPAQSTSDVGLTGNLERLGHRSAGGDFDLESTIHEQSARRLRIPRCSTAWTGSVRTIRRETRFSSPAKIATEPR